MNTIITPQLLKCNKLTWTEKVWTAYFSTLQSKDMLRNIKNEDIERDIGTTKRMIQYAVTALIDKGVLERKFINGANQARNLYIVKDYGY